MRTWVILDALEGTIIINPDKGQIEFYKQKQEEYLAGKTAAGPA